MTMLNIVQDDEEIFKAANEYLDFLFFKAQGKYEIVFKRNHENVSQVSQLKDCYSVINFWEDSDKLIEKSSLKFKYGSVVEEINDDFGEGLKIVFLPKESENNNLFFKIQFKIYDEQDFILIKIIDIKDNNKNPLPVHSISPLTIRNSFLWLSGTTSATDLFKISWFKNGWQSWSPCKVLFGKERAKTGPPNKMFRRILENQDFGIKGRFYSDYCAIITDLISKNSLILGFVTLKDQFSRIVLDYDNNKNVKLLTAFGCMDSVKLTESTLNSSEELFICFKSKNLGYYGLINYARVVNTYISEPRITEVPVGWCSWYYYYSKITQEEMMKNFEFFKKHRDALPIDFIQLDDGYQAAIGD